MDRQSSKFGFEPSFESTPEYLCGCNYCFLDHELIFYVLLDSVFSKANHSIFLIFNRNKDKLRGCCGAGHVRITDQRI